MGDAAPGPRGPLMSPTFWLHHAALAVRRRAEAGLRPIGLTYPQFCLLGAIGWLSATERPPTQQRAADLAGADRMMTSKLVGTLCARGLVARQDDPGDARARRLRLTPEGRAVTDEAVRLMAEVDAEVFGTGADRERHRQRLRAIAEDGSPSREDAST
ncbi:MAG TPA: MarR family winged helix-turn-helix transcriptional regulator [Stackebrandtia sp.]|uniref:MarR family winged helix-turn-helix transcriptional regulator n=1 Tax=Stackebrandtia sp. TaxID=2023065 RepID=UPI002D6B3CAD|nr:MarR family winged helix-turn-helix transcriptional regulator [Stackebrandtia sp.]HZE39811.1 MarR family winged helix-turn-helix transcriptional regulator [Stackebrandtia sp.]